MARRPKLTGIKAVVFDVFGTLVEIKDKRGPYRQLIQHMQEAGRAPSIGDGARIMSNNVSLADAAQMFGVNISNTIIAKLELDLHAELATIHCYPEVHSTLKTLRDAGFKIGLCSNLAAPYAAPVKSLLPFELHTYAWSFEARAVKPAPEIYEKLCADLCCLPHEVAMIGDTLEADFYGPRRFGMHGFHLARREESPVLENLKNLSEILPLLEISESAPNESVT